MDRPQVISLIHPENARSVRVAERLGEHLSGTTEVMGKPALVYRITRAEWEANPENARWSAASS
jgi:RimJ/RimL family protein N-acetyltransferase